MATPRGILRDIVRASRWYGGFALLAICVTNGISAQSKPVSVTGWSGNLHTKSSQFFGGAAGQCIDEEWDIKLDLLVFSNGCVVGKGSGKLVSMPKCSGGSSNHVWGYDRQARTISFSGIQGHFDGKEFQLRFPRAGWPSLGGIVSLSGSPPGQHPPTLRVQVTGSGMARGQTKTDVNIEGSRHAVGVFDISLKMSGATNVPFGLQYAISFGEEIVAAAARHNLDQTLLAAIAAQETGGPSSDSGQNIVGDNGHGYGVFQIDDRSHSDFTSTPQAMNPADNAEYAAGMMEDLLAKYGGDVHKALSAYNSGKGTRCGTKTFWKANGDTLCYADSVLRHQERLKSKKGGCHE